MKKTFFKLLLKTNNAILPRYAGKDPLELTAFQKGILAFRYWVLKNAL